MTVAHFATYDVFADTPFDGNQAAVIRDRHRHSDRQLLAWAKEIALAETVLYSARNDELNFRFANADRILSRCGHATLAGVADHVLLKLKGLRTPCREWSGFYQVGSKTARWCASLANYRRRRHHLQYGLKVAIEWPDRPMPSGNLSAGFVYAALGLTSGDQPTDRPLVIYNSGNRNALVPVKTVATLQHAKPDWTLLEKLFDRNALTDVHLYWLSNLGSRRNRLLLRCRNVFPYGVFEEPATGTASVSLAAALIDYRVAMGITQDAIDFLLIQGVGERQGRIEVAWRIGKAGAPTIWLIGRVFPVAEGLIVVPAG